MDPLPEIHYDEWFHQKHPHDDMPIATNDRFDMYGSSDADDAYSSRHETTPVFEEVVQKKLLTIHEKAYRLARANCNPFAVGGSEYIHDFDSKD